MKHTRLAGYCLLAGMLVATNGFAEDYDFEIGLAFDSTRFDGSQTRTTPGGTTFISSETDTDELSVFGRWYFNGLSDDKGPRARAAFVDRASSLSVAYSHSDFTSSALFTSNDPSSPFPPFDSSFESDQDSFVADLRYVDRDSGWFGDVGLLTSDFNSVDATGWNLGVGKYLFETTTLSLNVGQVDVSGGDSTAVVVAFSHLDDLGKNWQYAVDLGYSSVDGVGSRERDTWNAAIALYPTRDFEFGVALEEVSGNSLALNTDRGKTGVEGFASWFVTPNVQISARYRVDDVDFSDNIVLPNTSTISDTDQDSFAISAAIRF